MGAELAIPLIIGGATAGTMVTTSAIAASEQNKAARAAQRAASRAAAVQMQQVREQEALEGQKRFNEAQQIRSRLRVAAGESGIGLGGTYQALMRQADYDQAMNLDILSRNAMMNLARIQSGAAADLVSLQSRTRSPILESFAAGVPAGLAGLQTGLQIQGVRNDAT